ncbi:hypothetical protein K474DRAFT_1707813 [Panus rudis PR-1116 ss-1]|nr:hypothetical protein K474DRAFT_1707813 [Panus rudis PR-1116 ss-1]
MTSTFAKMYAVIAVMVLTVTAAPLGEGVQDLVKREPLPPTCIGPSCTHGYKREPEPLPPNCPWLSCTHAD